MPQTPCPVFGICIPFHVAMLCDLVGEIQGPNQRQAPCNESDKELPNKEDCPVLQPSNFRLIPLGFADGGSA